MTRAIRRMQEEEPGPWAAGRGTVRARLSAEVSLKVRREDGGIQPGEGGVWVGQHSRGPHRRPREWEACSLGSCTLRCPQRDMESSEISLARGANSTGS